MTENREQLNNAFNIHISRFGMIANETDNHQSYVFLQTKLQNHISLPGIKNPVPESQKIFGSVDS